MAPLNYTRFLDYATKLIFLRKVGGGYIFIHRLFMEHFVAMGKERGPLLWSDVVVVGYVGAIIYQFAEGTKLAINIAKTPDNAMSLFSRLVQLFEKMYKKARRSVDHEVIGNLVKEWFSMEKLKPIVEDYKHIPLCDELSVLCSSDNKKKSILSSIASYTKCFLHGDLHLRNILLGDRDILLDFAKSGSGPLALDVAKLCSDMIINISEMRGNRFPH